MKTQSICPRCKKMKNKKSRYCHKCLESKFEIVAFYERNKKTSIELHRELKFNGFLNF